jgi:TolB-like protein
VIDEPDAMRPVLLAREADFALGGLRVRPSRGEVENRRGTERLEPRVMQVLVVLAQADGRTVPREELVARCWGGLAVSPDAVNRVISRLRRLAEDEPHGFRIETLARIGYRLSKDEGASEARVPAPSTGLVAVLPFDAEGEADTARLAEGMSEAILSRLTRSGASVVARHSSFQFRGARKASAAAALKADYLVDGSVRLDGEALTVTAYLVDARQGVSLWSERHHASRAEVFALEERLAAQVAEVLQVRLNPAQGATPADPLVHDLYARALLGLEQPSREPIEQARAYLSEALARAPDFAPAWAALAEAQRLQMLYLPPPEQEAPRTESRRSAERALQLDPGLGQAFGAQAMLIPRFNRWAQVEQLFERGLAATPRDPALIHHHAQFLLATGRTAQSLERLQALQTLNPLSAAVAVEVAAALFDMDRDDEALSAVSRAYALWPAIMLVWSECVRLHVVVGDYDRVQALLASPPPSVQPDDVNLARRRLHMIARRDGDPQDMAAAVENFTRFAEIGVAPATVAIHALTTLDRPDLAIAVADRIFRTGAPQTQRPGVNMMGTFTLAGEPDSTVLFRRDTRSILRSPEVSEIFERIGLSAYWQASGSPPDWA